MGFRFDAVFPETFRFGALEYQPSPRERWLVSVLSYSLASLPVLLALGSAAAILFLAWEEKRHAPAGCRRLGLQGKNYLRDAGTATKTINGSARCRIQSLWIYPIKSCRGIELARSAVVATGLQYDRHFCLAQLLSPFPVSATDSQSARAAHKWRFITQREFPLMSQVRTELWVPDPASASYAPDAPAARSGGVVVVRFPFQADGWRGMLAHLSAKLRGASGPERSFRIPFEISDADVTKHYSREPVTVWRDTQEAINLTPLLPPELRYTLGVRNPLGLFRVGARRAVTRMTPHEDVLGRRAETGFADAFPIHLLGAASVRDLSARQARGAPRLDARRFRPNVLVEGAPPYAEDAWRRVRLGEGLFYVTGRCVRCRLPNVDPDTGQRHRVEPDRTLRATRDVDAGAPGKGCLGLNLVAARPDGEIRVGDELEVLETGENVYEQM